MPKTIKSIDENDVRFVDLVHIVTNFIECTSMFDQTKICSTL
jgi:hypothetical protein